MAAIVPDDEYAWAETGRLDAIAVAFVAFQGLLMTKR